MRTTNSRVVHPKIVHLTISFAVVLVSLLFALQTGAVSVDWNDWLNLRTIAFSFVGGDLAHVLIDGDSYVLWYLRMPRVLLAVLIGLAWDCQGHLYKVCFAIPCQIQVCWG